MPKLSAYKITKQFVDGLPGDRDAVFFDAQLTGFGVRTKPNGRKTYLVQYRNREGQTRKVSIGQHGALTPEEARKRAKVLLGRVANGEDPAEERADELRAETVADLCQAYISAVENGIANPHRAVIRGKGGKPKKASTLAEDKSRIKRHIIPLLGKRKVRDLRPKDISNFQLEVTEGKTATSDKDDNVKKRGSVRVSGGAGIASRTVGLLGGILTYAMSKGIIDANPCRGVTRPPDGKRKVRLSAEQYRALGAAIQAAEADGEPWQAVDAVRLLALTGCRKNEVAGLRRIEVDVSGHALRLTDTKENASVRPLGTAAIDILSKRLGRSVYVFHSDRDPSKPYGGLPGAWKRLLARVDPSFALQNLTLHGLRHAFASVAHDLRYTMPTIKALIGHGGGSSSTDGYVHHLDENLIGAADKVSGTIATYMDGRDAAN